MNESVKNSFTLPSPILDNGSNEKFEEFGPLPNHIAEYIKTNVGENNFKELFEGDVFNIDLRTDLTLKELILVNRIRITDIFLKENLGFSVYSQFITDYLKLKVSLDRKSRSEFVDINRKDRFNQHLREFTTFSDLSKVKQ